MGGGEMGGGGDAAMGGAVWYTTCGDPVCTGWRDKGIPRCSMEKEGAACAPEGARCNRGDMCNTLLLCARSDPKAPGCPISRRAAKQDIEYLSDQDLASYRDALLGLKLATYRYKAAGGASQARRHLGFMIDDVAPQGGRAGVCIDPERDMVDLYGYTSLAVAAIQAQAREIAALRSEVTNLKAQVARARPQAAATSSR
jgi:hypothetical protein